MFPNFFIKRDGKKIPLTLDEVNCIDNNLITFRIAEIIEKSSSFKGQRAWEMAKEVREIEKKYLLDTDKAIDAIINKYEI